MLCRPRGAVKSRGEAAARLSERAGLVLDPWQRFWLDVAMGERADDSWAAAEVGAIVSRQNGKNGTVEARELYGLTVLDEEIIHTAHLFKTTRESFNRLLALVEGHPDVAELLTYKVASPASGYEMRFRDGGRISFIARSRTSGRGLTGDLLVFDEAQDLSDEMQEALLPTISARPGSQAWYFGSAPLPNSEVLHRIRRRGRQAQDERLAYMEWSADPDADPDDRDAWAQANPALGVRILEEHIESERAQMSPEGFARERLSISPDIIEGESIIPAADWAACAGLTGIEGQPMFALDVTPARTWGSFSVAGPSNLGGHHVELVDRKPGTDWLVGRAVELQADHGGVLAVGAGSPAASLLVDLETAGVRVLEVSTADHAKACGVFFDAVARHDLHHLDQAELNVAVAGAAQKFYGDSWLWDRRHTQVDISPLVSATLALWAAVQAPDEVMAGPEVVLL